MSEKMALFSFFLSFAILCSSRLLASDEQQYQAGSAFASTQQAPLPKEAGTIPGYQGANVPEASLSQGRLQETLVAKMKQKDSVSSFISQTHDERLRFQLDPQTDRLFKEADAVTANPEKVLEAASQEHYEPDIIKTTRHTCLEAGDPELYTCHKQLQVSVNVTPAVKEVRKCCGNPIPWHLDGRGVQWASGITPCKSCGNYYKNSEIIVSPEQFTVAEQWDSNCTGLEDQVDKGQCFYVEKKCIEGAQTRLINNKPVTRNCWKESYTYACEQPTRKDCDIFRSKGCYQVASNCKDKRAWGCALFEQTFECKERQRGVRRISLSGKVPWCLDGNCASMKYEDNPDMMEALSKLMIFKEIQKDMDMKIPSIFKGESYACTRNCLDFKDCCKTGKGWGVSLGLVGCSEREKGLAKLREDKKCVYVGTHCAEKKPLVGCIRKKSVFCCFGTKLARILHEQGRPQLGWGFGAAESPQCQGFTVEALSKVDFEKINLSELLSDMYSQVKPPNLEKLGQDLQKDWKNKIPTKDDSQKLPLQTVKEEKKDATF